MISTVTNLYKFLVAKFPGNIFRIKILIYKLKFCFLPMHHHPDRAGRLMSRNFSVRERLYGSACLGASNLRMVELGRQCGAYVKFPGSGGAVLGLPMEDTDMVGGATVPNLPRNYSVCV